MLNKFKNFFQSQTRSDVVPREFTATNFELNQRTYGLRRLTTASLDQLLMIERDVYAGQTPWDRLVFLNELNKRHNHLYVGLYNDQEALIGFIGSWYDDFELHITNIAVLSAWQNLGLGRELMTFMINQAKQRDCQQVTLETRASNEPAKHLYHQLGFIDHKIRKNYYALDNEDAISMRLSLNDQRQESPLMN